MVRRIVDEHAARVSIRNRDSGGAEVEITFTKLAREAVV
jgi:nitrogen fixation/metabolism regulation signal transduction histidine kinase